MDLYAPHGECCDCEPGSSSSSNDRCLVYFCVRGCNGIHLGNYNWTLNRGSNDSSGYEQVAAGSAGTVPPFNCAGVEIDPDTPYLFVYAFSEPESDIWSSGFQEHEFTVPASADCPVTLNIDVEPVEGYECDPECEPCEGVPRPTCFVLTDPDGNEITLNEANFYSACQTYTSLEEIPRACKNAFGICPDYAIASVPVRYELTGCNPLVLTLWFLVVPRLNGGACANETYVGPCEAEGETNNCRTTEGPVPTPINGWPCCPDYLDPLGDVDCTYLNDMRSILACTVGPCPFPYFAPCADGFDSPWLINEIGVMGVSVEIPLDCESGNPFDVDFSIDLDAECLCDTTAVPPAGTATSTHHPLGRILDAGDAWNIRTC